MELPEVCRAVSVLQGFVGRKVRSATAVDCNYILGCSARSFNEWGRAGEELKSVVRRGKNVLLQFSGRSFIWSPGRSGNLFGTHLRARISFAAGRIDFTDSSGVRHGYLQSFDSFEELVLSDTLRVTGTEVSSELFTADMMSYRVGRSRRPIGALLLDQKIAPGFGNRLRCEALYYAGLEPMQRFSKKIAQQIVDGCKRAVCESVDNVFRREFCSCGHPVSRGKIYGWSVFWCKKCQK